MAVQATTASSWSRLLTPRGASQDRLTDAGGNDTVDFSLADDGVNNGGITIDMDLIGYDNNGDFIFNDPLEVEYPQGRLWGRRRQYGVDGRAAGFRPSSALRQPV